MACRLSLVVALLWLLILAASLRPAHAEQVEVHYAPVENLERIDVSLIRSARKTLDIAAYTLTDRPVVDALVDARRRGVAVRVVLDPSQRQAIDLLQGIADDIRMKTPSPYMHLKAYAIDGIVLRSGSANLSASGLKKQDNDLIVLPDAKTVAAFRARFESIWTSAVPWSAPTDSRAPERGGVASAIKGNVNRKGERIFHAPDGRGYARVKMDGAGKRWFCSEAQAVAAGWRKAAW